MVWYDGKEISEEEVLQLPEENYALIRHKGNGLIGGPVRAKSELIEALKNITLPKGEVEIQKFKLNYTSLIDHSKYTPLKFD